MQEDIGKMLSPLVGGKIEKVQALTCGKAAGNWIVLTVKTREGTIADIVVSTDAIGSAPGHLLGLENVDVGQHIVQVTVLSIEEN